MGFSARQMLVTMMLSRFRCTRDITRLACRRYAHSTALITSHGSLTFAQLGERVLRLAHAINAMGISKGDSIFVLLPDCAEQVEVRLAAHEMGAILTMFSAVTPPERVLDAARLITPRLFIYDPTLGEMAAKSLTQDCPNILLLSIGSDYETLLTNHAPKKSVVEVGPDDIAVMGFTSGTTGQPKILTATHGTYLRSLKLMVKNVGVGVKSPTQDIVMVGIPLTGAGSGIVIPALLGGAALLIPPAYDAGVFVELIQRHRVTRLFTTPSLLIDLLDHPKLDQYDLSSLHTVIYGTELMPAAKLEEALKRFGPIFQQGYGSAEVLPPVSMLQKSDHWQGGRPAPREVLSSAGRVVPGVSVVIADDNDLPLPIGAIGQVLINSPTVFHGYWKRPDLNAEALRGGYLHTNDMGYLDKNSYLHILGRQSDLIRRNGHVTYPRWVEEAVHNHAAVKEASMVQVAQRAIMVVSLRQAYRGAADREQLANEILSFLKQRVPAEDLPDELEVVDELPRSYLAKVLRREVRVALASREEA